MDLSENQKRNKRKGILKNENRKRINIVGNIRKLQIPKLLFYVGFQFSLICSAIKIKSQTWSASYLRTEHKIKPRKM